MCTVCGCGSNEPDATHSKMHEHEHVHADGTVHRHTHEHAHGHGHPHDHDHAAVQVHEHPGFIDYGCGPAGAHVPGMSAAQLVRIEKDILSKNDAFARKNRQWFGEHGVLALNLVSSPGSGKTALLVRTIEAMEGWMPVTVIEGDQQTSNDAERIRATGVRALQINTGKGCHLDAQMVGHAVEHLSPNDDSVLFIENVGNLVCPAAFDLGEAHKVVILSVTEGEDKPLKYPDMFAAADLMLLNKIDLLPYLDFDVDLAVECARRINPQLNVIQVSATSGEGFTAWVEWIRQASQKPRNEKAKTVDMLRERIAQLEAALEKSIAN